MGSGLEEAWQNLRFMAEETVVVAEDEADNEKNEQAARAWAIVY